MSDRHLVVDHLKFSYEGLFNSAELYNLIATWFYEKTWDWYEKINQEQVTLQGKQIRIVLEPWKSVSDYHKITMKIHLQMIDVKEVEVEHEGKKLHLNHGVVRIVFDGFVVSDRKGRWNGSPFKWFVAFMAEKYFFKEHYHKFEVWIKSDLDDLYNKIKNYLNVYKYTYQR
ncbi:hypothetical protein COV20_02925 [Candidatus Woesearchaeota archaeon CG10_big_fil_rev_8_21_14_0_10_45_16]|nr:MAG: hypothetical protein COV20_02925 [Candidatus Woesearchaeota archaeon CG10_big_fil_rev_8_21_14_0_10_45_16]